MIPLLPMHITTCKAPGTVSDGGGEHNILAAEESLNFNTLLLKIRGNMTFF